MSKPKYLFEKSPFWNVSVSSFILFILVSLNLLPSQFARKYYLNIVGKVLEKVLPISHCKKSQIIATSIENPGSMEHRTGEAQDAIAI